MKAEEIKIKEFVKDWINGHEPDTFIKNEHGVVIFSAGPSSLNLTVFFEELLKDYVNTTTPQGNVSAEEIWDKHFNDWVVSDIIKNNALPAMEEYRNQPAKFTPERTAKEEAAKLKHEVGPFVAIVVVDYAKRALQLRGLDTSHEKEVLTILKSM